MQTCIKNNKKMEKEKCYTPNEDEFSSGFEYERYESSWVYDIKPIKNNLDGSIEAKVLSEPKQVADWRKRVYKLDDFCYIKDGELECWYNPEVLRVKYLDREDIESFGLSAWNDTDINIYFNNQYKTIIYRGSEINLSCVYNKRSNWLCVVIEDKWIEKSTSNTLFAGYIKNKSEFSRLLKQLSII